METINFICIWKKCFIDLIHFDSKHPIYFSNTKVSSYIDLSPNNIFYETTYYIVFSLHNEYTELQTMYIDSGDQTT